MLEATTFVEVGVIRQIVFTLFYHPHPGPLPSMLAILKYGGNLDKKAMLEHIIKKKVVQTY